jgi:hypothetical protein
MHVGYRELPSKRRFGVELEVTNTCSKDVIGMSVSGYEVLHGSKKDVVVTKGKGRGGWAETRRNDDFWHVKYDSTCGPLGKYNDSGWEIASYIGCGHNHVKSISGIADWLANAGLKTNRNCGLHIHADASDLTNSQVGSLMARWIKIESYLFGICSKRRSKSIYCKPLKEKYREMVGFGYEYDPHNTARFWSFMSPRNFNTHNNDEKKCALNFVGYAYGQIMSNYDKSTIELRLPECILETDHVLNWVRLFLNFIDSCKDYPEPGPSDLLETTDIKEVLRCIGLQEKEGFFILDQNLLETKKWFLKKLARNKETSVVAFEANNLLAFISQI